VNEEENRIDINMHKSLVYMIGFHEITQGESSQSFINEIISRWPGVNTHIQHPEQRAEQNSQNKNIPAFEHISSCAQVMSNRVSQDHEPTVCVLFLKGDAPHEGFFPFLDHLIERSIPLLIIANHFSSISSRLSEEAGVIVCPSNESADCVAARIHALVARQRVVEDLRRDLQTARRFQSGLNREMTKMDEELQLAAMIQREFLPKKLPELNDLRFGVFFRPVGFVSGDIYHITRLDEHHVAFFLADAVGHGVPAALMTMIIAHSLTMKEIYRDSYRIIPPGEVLAHLNESILSHHAENGRFATSVYGITDTRDYTTTIAAAGHPPPLHINGQGESEFIDAKGGLLGVFPDEVYEEISFTLKKGDRLFIYSDGFEMAFPKENAVDLLNPTHRRLPSLRYLDEIKNACKPDTSVEETIEELRHAIDRQPGSLHQVDDLTGICLARQDIANTKSKQQKATITNKKQLAA